MPSREQRRLKAKKGETVSESIEKRKESHPFIYAFSVIILVIIVVTFVAVGPGGPLRASSGGVGSIVFGSYDGRDIVFQPGNYFATQRDRMAEQVRQSGQNQDAESQVYQIWKSAFDQTAIHTAIMLAIQNAGVQVSDDKIDKTLLTYPAYLDNGKFSEELYRKATLAERVQTRKNVQEQLLNDQFVQDYLTGLRTSDREKEFIISMAQDERSFDFVSFPFSGFPADEVKKYAEANKAKFKKVKVSRILVKSGEGEAKEIRKKLTDKTSTFEDLAKTYSKDSFAPNGGDMGWRFSYDLEADFDDKDLIQKVFALKTGEISDVLKGTYGWMIYRCDANPVDPDLTDPATEEAIKSYILRYERGKVEDFFSERAGKLSRRAGEIGFQAAAKELGSAVNKTDYFPINLQSVFVLSPVKAVPDTATPASAVYSEDFFFRGFSLGKDQVSPPIVLDDQIVVLKVSGERKMPADTLKIMPNFLDYLANQSLQTDLQSELMNPKKLKDDFDATFFKYVYAPRSQ